MQASIGAFDPTLLSYCEARTDVNRIQAIVAAYFHVDLARLVNDQRTQRLVMARHIAMYLMRELTHLSFPRIGQFFQRDHSTIVHAYYRIADRMRDNPQFATMVEKLKRECAGPGDAVA